MKNISFLYLASFLWLLSSCQVIGGIFKAGVWAGAFMVIGILALVIFLITRGFNKK